LIQALAHQIHGRITIPLVGHLKNRPQRPAAQGGGRPAQHRLGDGVEILHVALGIGGDDGIADGTQRDLGELLFLEYRADRLQQALPTP